MTRLLASLENALPELARRSFHATIFVPAAVIGRAPKWPADDPSMTFEEVRDGQLNS